MAVCKFFLEGNCRFGSSCRNEHPSGLNSQNQFNNRIGFNSGNNNQPTPFGMNNARNGPFRGRQENKRRQYELDAERIRADFTKERPIWPFSSYGPTMDQPRQLIEGDAEISAEEMRCRAYLVRAQGRPQSEINEMETTANAKVSKVVQEIMSDTMAAIRWVQRGEDEHPNRWDVIQASTDGTLDKLRLVPSTQPSFAQSPNAPRANSSPFGAVSAPSAQPGGAFGKPSFGQPSLPTSSPFGAPSNQGASPFNQPSTTNPSPFAQSTTNPSPFGSLSKPANTTFGQPSTNTTSPFGQPATSTTAFGQPSSLASSSPFGKPSLSGAPAFGQPSGFGQPSSLNTNSPFASSSSPFGKLSNPPTDPAGIQNASNNSNASPFAQAVQSNANASPFAQAVQSNANTSPFAQNKDNTSPFAVKQAPNGPFGTASPFNSATPFNQGNQASNPFVQNNTSTSTTATTNSPFATASRPSITTVTSNSNSFASASRSAGALNISSNTKIFPTGVPTAPLCEDPPAYQYGEHEGAYKEAYEIAKQSGMFAGGVMPMVAPKWEWVSFQL